MQKRQNKLKWNNYRIGLILTAAMTFVILLGIFWTPYDPEMMQGSLKLKGPSLAPLVRDGSVWAGCAKPCCARRGKHVSDRSRDDLDRRDRRDDPRSCDRIFRRLAGRDPDA